jgi:hypothetical protein
MSWSTTMILIRNGKPQADPSVFADLGLGKAECHGHIDFESASSLRFDGLALAQVGKWTVLVGDVGAFEASGEVGDRSIWCPSVEVGLLALSRQGPIFGLQTYGSSGTHGFTWHVDGRLRRMHLVQEEETIFDEGCPLEEEKEVFAAESDGEDRVFGLMARLAVDLRTIFSADFSAYGFPDRDIDGEMRPDERDLSELRRKAEEAQGFRPSQQPRAARWLLFVFSFAFLLGGAMSLLSGGFLTKFARESSPQAQSVELTAPPPGFPWSNRHLRIGEHVALLYASVVDPANDKNDTGRLDDSTPIRAALYPIVPADDPAIQDWRKRAEQAGGWRNLPKDRRVPAVRTFPALVRTRRFRTYGEVVSEPVAVVPSVEGMVLGTKSQGAVFQGREQIESRFPSVDLRLAFLLEEGSLPRPIAGAALIVCGCAAWSVALFLAVRAIFRKRKDATT